MLCSMLTIISIIYNINNNNKETRQLPIWFSQALETLGPVNESAVKLLNNLGHRIASTSSDDKEGQFLYQRLSIALQRFNAILLHESFVSDPDP